MPQASKESGGGGGIGRLDKDTGNKLPGNVTEEIGDLTDHQKLEAEGAAQQVKGSVQNAKGSVKSALGDDI